MKPAITFLFLFVFIGTVAAAGGAVQKKAGVPDTVGAVKTVKDSAAKKDSAVAVHFGKVTVAATPESAEVSVDSIVKGTSPLTLDSLRPGPHVLIVKQKGYFGKKVIVDVVQDSVIAVAVSLVKPAALVVASDPAGARIVFDGKDAGVTPYENAKVKPGDHTLRLEKDSFVPLDLKIAATEGRTDSLSFTLVAVKPQTGAQAAPPQPAAKHGIDTTILIILTSLFVVFGIALFAVEAGSK
jgi:PEGA domain